MRREDEVDFNCSFTVVVVFDGIVAYAVYAKLEADGDNGGRIRRMHIICETSDTFTEIIVGACR